MFKNPSTGDHVTSLKCAKKSVKIDFVTVISNKDKNCEKKCWFLYIILSLVLRPKLINKTKVTCADLLKFGL